MAGHHRWPEIGGSARARVDRYVHGLDLVRFASAILVATFHLTWQTPSASPASAGWVGVQIFFVISGFVIAHSAQFATPLGFLRGRFLRLYPAAWCAAVVNVVALSTALPAWQRINASLSLPALLGSVTLVNAPFLASAYWTLPIELSFYGVIFAVLLFGGVAHLRRVAIVLVLWSAPFIAASSLHYSGLIELPAVDIGYGWKNMSLLRHGVFFAIGMLIWLRPKRTGDVVLLAVAACLAVLEIYCRSVELAPKYGASLDPWTLGRTAAAVFTAAVAAIVLSVVMNAHYPRRFQGWTRALGLATYPYYLLHEAVGGLALYLGLSSGMSFASSVVAALVAVWLLAHVIARWAEPALRHLFGSVIDVGATQVRRVTEQGPPQA